MEGRLRQYDQIIYWLIICYWTVSCQPNDKRAEAKTSLHTASPNTTLIATGDLVLRLGDGFYSQFFRNFSTCERRFSHVGIALVEKGEVFIIHAEADERTGVGGVRRDLLKEFLKQAVDWGVYRLRAPESDRVGVARAASNYLAQAIPFDTDFDVADSTRFYCSELAMHCVNRAVGRPLICPNTKVRNRLFVAIDETYLNELTYMVLE